MRRPLALTILAATALVGIFALSMYGEEDNEEEGEESGVGTKPGDTQSDIDPKSTILPEEAQKLYDIALALTKRGDYVQGEKIMRKVLEVIEGELGANHGAVGDVLVNLGLLLQAQQKTAEAELVIRRALVVEKTVFGDESSEAATVMSTLASILEEIGNFPDSEELFRKCLQIKQECGKPNEVASANCLLAGVLRNMAKLEEAESHYLQAVAILSESFGDSHDSITILNKTLSLFPKLKLLRDVKLKVNGEVVTKIDAAWGSIAEETLDLELVCVDPMTAHVELVNSDDLEGRAALVLRGECSFSEKVTRCIEAGAKAVIVMSSDEMHPDSVFQMGAPESYQSPVPVCMVSYTNGQNLSNFHMNGKSSIQFLAASPN